MMMSQLTQQTAAPFAATVLNDAHSVVIKVGTALVFDEATRQPRTGWMAGLAGEVMDLRAEGKKVTIVSSGAIALGRMKLGETKPKAEMSVAEKQAMAAVGQQELMKLWDDAFKPYGMAAAQLLLTKNDFKNGRIANARKLFREQARKILPRFFPEEESPKSNVMHTLAALHKSKAIAIINENDATATDEIKFGDNDRLGALVAKMVKAQAYVIFSDVDGLYTANPQKDPNAKHVPVVAPIDETIRAMASGPVSVGSSGGMISKVQAAAITTQAGCATIICQGNPPPGSVADTPVAALLGGARSTVFLAEPTRNAPNRTNPLARRLLTKT